ncbi:MAG: class I SAM-dependent methyltransferase [Candidatus Latescibacterota bacterium]|nr:class I SAM-dependent methyltransferase [Candidatus Latescibacterota bacterium]
MDPQDLTAACFERTDQSDDALFYREARKVVHIDDGAIAALTSFLAEHLQLGGVYLDLMSSWRSHLPPDLNASRVIGLGMNAAEMTDNPQLDEWVVRDLNDKPRLPFEDQSFDAVICTVSVQYITHPVDIFRDVNRILNPGAPFLVSFSNRCFPQKAIALWLAMTNAQHIELVESYFSGDWDEVQNRNCLTEEADPLFVVWANRSALE